MLSGLVSVCIHVTDPQTVMDDAKDREREGGRITDVKKGVKEKEKDARMEDTKTHVTRGLESFAWRLRWY